MNDGILKGIRVVEMARYIAAPMCTRILASLGAEVIKVESNNPLDNMRLDPDGTRDGWRWPDNGALKKSVSLSMKHPEAVKIIVDLLKISDVCVDNMLPDQPARLGLDYDAIQQMNPGIIIVRMPGLGLTGPYCNFLSYGMGAQALGGLDDITGFPGSPTGPNYSYPDYISGVNGAMAVISALDFRRRTGKGQVIEAPLYMSMAAYLGSATLDYSANKNVAKGIGNRDRYMFPHNAYKCRGEDRWCVIAISSDQEWASLCQVLGKPGWANKPEFETVLGRKQNSEEIDRHIEEWTSNRPPEEVFELLQKAGIPAGIVAKGSDLMSAPHLKEREYFQTTLNHPRFGSHPSYMVPPIHFSEITHKFGPAPKLGEHNDYVYGKLLGLSEGEIKRLTDAGVFA
ncbi:MAG: CaiB/BaiF CoA transferase family protein [Smithellaceae bacterium]